MNISGNPRRGRLAALLACAVAVMAANAAVAAFPEKPIRLYVTTAPGGANDIVSRLVASHMAKTLHQPVVVENQGGGGGTIALQSLARAAPDGYSLAMTATTFVAAPYLYKQLPYDTEKSFAPVTQVVTFYNILVARPDFPARTLPAFIEYARKNNVSNGGGNIGGQSWVMLQKLNSLAGTKIEYLAYKGAGPALTDLMGGHIDTAFSDPASMRALIKDGRVSPIAVTTAKRAAGFPDVPAIAEAVPGYVAEGWIGMLAPAGTPADVVATLQKAVAAALADPEIRNRLLADDFGIVGSTPDQFATFLKSELANYGRIIKATGFVADELPK